MPLRKQTLFQVICIIFCIICSSCAPTSYFQTPNDFYRKNVILYKRDGTVEEGMLTIQFEDKMWETLPMKLIDFTPKGSHTEQHLSFSDVKAYRLNGDLYVAKNINLYTAGNIKGLFVKLLSPESSVIQLYQLDQTYKASPGGDDRNYYYISVPSYSPVQLIELHSNYLTPNFEYKMADFVEDCPALYKKIRNKQDGYHYVFLTATFRKVEIMKRIIQEYDSCGLHQ